MRSYLTVNYRRNPKKVVDTRKAYLIGKQASLNVTLGGRPSPVRVRVRELIAKQHINLVLQV